MRYVTPVKLPFLLTLFLVGCGASGSDAGEWHSDLTLACSDCHAMHFSVGAAPPSGSQPGGPWQKLLLSETTNGICLSCHDGSNALAPDVLAPVSMYAGTGSETSAAGFFSPPGTSNDKGHDLGVASARVPYSSMTGVTLSCSVCHNPHGNTNHRNLIPSPGVGSGRNVVLGTDVFEKVHPASPPMPEATTNAYARSNTGYKSGFSAWCTQCHDALAADVSATSPSHFRKHPAYASMNSTGYHVDVSHWVSGQGAGFGTTSGDGVEGIPRLRFQQPSAADFATSVTVSASNEVFCLSCHLAHGGTFKSSLLWPAGDVQQVDSYSGCEQCHNK